ncbi:hypothetical protein D3C75_827260 [compost metagenome]
MSLGGPHLAKRLVQSSQDRLLDPLALETQRAHGLEQLLLSGTTGSALAQLEQAVVQRIEHALQALLEELP